MSLCRLACLLGMMALAGGARAETGAADQPVRPYGAYFHVGLLVRVGQDARLTGPLFTSFDERFNLGGGGWLRVGARLRGLRAGVLGDFATGIWGPDSKYAGLFLGGTPIDRNHVTVVVELEGGLHHVSNVKDFDYTVNTVEAGTAYLPYAGATMHLMVPYARMAKWKIGAWVQFRVDLAKRHVESVEEPDPMTVRRSEFETGGVSVACGWGFQRLL